MDLVLLVFAFVLFVLAATNFIPEPTKTRIIAAGLACWVAASIFGQGLKYFGDIKYLK